MRMAHGLRLASKRITFIRNVQSGIGLPVLGHSNYGFWLVDRKFSWPKYLQSKMCYVQMKIKWSRWRGLNTGWVQIYTRLRALWLYTWSGRAFQEGVLLRGFHLILWFRNDLRLRAECGFPETRPWNTRWVIMRQRHRSVLVYLPPTPTHPATPHARAPLKKMKLNCSK